LRFTKKDKKLIAIAQNQEVYEEDYWGTSRLVGYRCKICKRVFTSLDDLEVDHIYPRSRGGVDTPRNLRLLCPRCNRKKGAAIRGKSPTAKRKTGTARKKPTAVKRKSSATKRKVGRAKRKSSVAKRRRSTVKKKSAAGKRKRR